MFVKKQRVKKPSKESGFTLIELLVALAILALFYGMVIVNFSYWRGPQYIRVSASELATNINKIRSYSLSARSLGGQPARWYILEFSRAAPRKYTLSVLSSGEGGDSYQAAVETFNFSGGVYMDDIVLRNSSGASSHPDCLQLAYSLPFGRTLMSPDCSLNQNKTLSSLDALANGRLEVVVAREGTSVTRKIVVDGLSGRVEIE